MGSLSSFSLVLSLLGFPIGVQPSRLPAQYPLFPRPDKCTAAARSLHSRELMVVDVFPDQPENRKISNFWFVKAWEHCVQQVNNGTSYGHGGDSLKNKLYNQTTNRMEDLRKPDPHCLLESRRNNVLLGFLWGTLFIGLLAITVLVILKRIRKNRTLAQTKKNSMKENKVQKHSWRDAQRSKYSSFGNGNRLQKCGAQPCPSQYHFSIVQQPDGDTVPMIVIRPPKLVVEEVQRFHPAAEDRTIEEPPNAEDPSAGGAPLTPGSSAAGPSFSKRSNTEPLTIWSYVLPSTIKSSNIAISKIRGERSKPWPLTSVPSGDMPSSESLSTSPLRNRRVSPWQSHSMRSTATPLASELSTSLPSSNNPSSREHTSDSQSNSDGPSPRASRPNRTKSAKKPPTTEASTSVSSMAFPLVIEPPTSGPSITSASTTNPINSDTTSSEQPNTETLPPTNRAGKSAAFMPPALDGAGDGWTHWLSAKGLFFVG
ncbi:hypothetical protein B0O99DRAFT_183308 [Bisporella sp. PMI_857]|nr:hypothetical protein B0O99DRAFT_183308 [Bisporella sp. PMI_857]